MQGRSPSARALRSSLPLLSAALCAAGPWGASAHSTADGTARDPWAAPFAPPPALRIVVETRERTLAIFSGKSAVARFRVSVGRDNAYLARHSRPDDRLLSGTHVVEPGNTLWSLSRRYGVDFWALTTLNRKLDARALRPGTQVRLPRPDIQLTPTGEFRISNMTPNPVYRREGEVIPPYRRDRRNEFGVGWIGLSRSPYGIHGTNLSDGIGQFNTRGCIRMKNRDVAELFELVHVGTPVLIH